MRLIIFTRFFNSNMRSKPMQRAYVGGRLVKCVDCEFTGKGILLRGQNGGGVLLRGGGSDKVSKWFKKAGSDIGKFFVSKGFKNAVRFARKNVLTPLLTKLAPMAVSALPQALKMIPAVGVPASAVASMMTPQLNKLALSGINAVDGLASKHGYGITVRGGGSSSIAGDGITLRGSQQIQRAPAITYAGSGVLSSGDQVVARSAPEIKAIEKGFVLSKEAFSKSLPINVPKSRATKKQIKVKL